MADKKISELDQVLQINNDAVIPISQNSGGTPTTYKAQITQIGAEIGEDQTFSNLNTTDKTLVGAINEVAQGGGGGGSSNANLAPDYDATSTYAVGDWCIYNGTLYQCNTAIPTAEAFDPTHWTAKKIVDELDDKVDTSDFLATLLPIQSGSATNTKDYIDTGLSGKADKTSAVQIATFDFSKTINATTQATYGINRSDFNLPNNAVAVSVFLREYTSNSVNAGGLVYSAYVNPTANNVVAGAIYNGTNANRTYNITATLLYTLS